MQVYPREWVIEHQAQLERAANAKRLRRRSNMWLAAIVIVFAMLVALPLVVRADSSCPPPVYMCDSNGNCSWVQMVAKCR